MEHLNLSSFKEKVFNPDESKEWKFKGARPAIIDFYADWCGPCRMVAPVLEELQKEYEGRMDIYKVNTEQAPDLAGLFSVSSIPTILFIPQEGQPAVSVGAMNKPGFLQAIRDVLKIPGA